MKFIVFVLVPALIQILVGGVVMFAHKPGGEFVGLGVMLMGMYAIPVTTVLNWERIRSKSPMSLFGLITGTFYTTLVFPVLCIALYLFASWTYRWLMAVALYRLSLTREADAIIR